VHHEPLQNPAELKLLTGLRQDEISAVLAVAVRQRFDSSHLIIRAGERASRLFLVTRGEADYLVFTHRGEEILLKRLVPGEVFGVAAFLANPVEYLGSVRPVHHSEVLVWEHRSLRQLVAAYPQLMENAFRIALDYILLYSKRRRMLVSDASPARLATVMAALSSSIGHVLSNGIEIEITNADLAARADMTPFTVSRMMSRWEHAGIVEKARSKVIIRSPEKLLEVLRQQ